MEPFCSPPRLCSRPHTCSRALSRARCILPSCYSQRPPARDGADGRWCRLLPWRQCPGSPHQHMPPIPLPPRAYGSVVAVTPSARQARRRSMGRKKTQSIYPALTIVCRAVKAPPVPRSAASASQNARTSAASRAPRCSEHARAALVNSAPAQPQLTCSRLHDTTQVPAVHVHHPKLMAY